MFTLLKVITKIIAAPLVVVLTISWAFLIFVFCWFETILNFVSGIVAIIAIVLLFTGHTTGGIMFFVTAFLISPVGLPAIAKWLIDGLDVLNDALKCFITS